ncbi:Ferrochelatase [Symbiodinium microadriaticum]|uniref:Ferrochelatase n=1 Tax=Symbiodinium microadriaticum TaxID=2951 RepID=A0A1Q9CDK6_SYMMI|nr:Ferrochelatase [Symbiodinium microadriaticum]
MNFLVLRLRKKLAVVAPSFTADCVETLEELGITGREDFEAAGGEVVIPCLNSSEHWAVKNLAQIVREHIAARDPIDAIQTSRARQHDPQVSGFAQSKWRSDLYSGGSNLILDEGGGDDEDG